MMFYVVAPLNSNYLGRPCINKLGLIDPRLICINMFATKGARFIHDSRCTLMKLYIATVEDCRMMSPGWWYTYPSDPSENYEFVSWDDEIPNIWKNKIYVPNHQPEIIKVSFTFSVTKCCYTKEIHAKVATASRQCRTASQFHAMIKLRSTGYVPTSATFR